MRGAYFPLASTGLALIASAIKTRGIQACGVRGLQRGRPRHDTKLADGDILTLDLPAESVALLKSYARRSWNAIDDALRQRRGTHRHGASPILDVELVGEFAGSSFEGPFPG